MKELLRERSKQDHQTFARSLEIKAGPEDRAQEPESGRVSLEGLKIITFWLLILACTATGWWFLFLHVIPFMVRWFYH